MRRVTGGTVGKQRRYRGRLRKRMQMYDTPECREADVMTRVIARFTRVEIILVLAAGIFAVAAGAIAAPL